MIVTREIPQAEWRLVLDDLSRLHAGAAVSLEVLHADQGLQTHGDGFTLLGLTADGGTGCASIAAILAARGESPTAFDGRCTPALSVARRSTRTARTQSGAVERKPRDDAASHIRDILPPRALIAGRLARLGAARDFHHGLPAGRAHLTHLIEQPRAMHVEMLWERRTANINITEADGTRTIIRLGPPVLPDGRRRALARLSDNEGCRP